VNSGERDELIVKIVLTHMRDNAVKFIDGSEIKSVGSDKNNSYGRFPKIDPKKIPPMSDQAVQKLAASMGIGKAPVKTKSDVYLNGIGYSIKSFQKAPPAIVNHTARPGFETACQHSGAVIGTLDQIINDYWKLRMAGTIKEDVKVSDANSPFRNQKNYLKPILNYFLFDGSGSGIYNDTAQLILDVVDPCNCKTWHLLDKSNAVDHVWERLIMSLRATKGMPSKYDPQKHPSVAIWTRKWQGKHRGALHVRVGREK